MNVKISSPKAKLRKPKIIQPLSISLVISFNLFFCKVWLIMNYNCCEKCDISADFYPFDIKASYDYLDATLIDLVSNNQLSLKMVLKEQRSEQM